MNNHQCCDCCDCCYPEIIDPRACGCCAGTAVVTPVPIYNRPGLEQLDFRIGRHSQFLSTMLARLSSMDYPALADLTTREPSDPAIAMLDAWATVADVLTFYQERIANEGYLRSAQERRSILELARLVGYRLKPGVAASVFLAYTIEASTSGEVLIAKGNRCQSIPNPGETAQSFETAEDLTARTQWNKLQPRLSLPQTARLIQADPSRTIYLKGTSLNLKVNDPLLVDFTGGSATPAFLRIQSLAVDTTADRTRIELQPSTAEGSAEFANAQRLIADLTRPPSLQPRNKLRLRRSLQEQFKRNSEAGYRLLGSVSRPLKDTLATAAANAKVAADNPVKVYVLRAKASPFGHNAPREPVYGNGNVLAKQPWPEWLPHPQSRAIVIEISDESDAEVSATAVDAPSAESPSRLYLDRAYEQIVEGSYLVVDTGEAKVFRANGVQTLSRHAYGVSGETTVLDLDGPWWQGQEAADISELRSTKIYAQPELLELAEAPITDPICGGVGDLIELDGFYADLQAGRWVIVSGERELEGTSGVRFSELAMISSVSQDVINENQTDTAQHTIRAGESTHTFIQLAEQLAYCFKRDTVTIYGNVVNATHGETRQEVLGSGDASKPLQAFELKQKPLTFVAANNPQGVDSTLAVYVNDRLWQERETFIAADERARIFSTRTDNEDTTRVQFGDGIQGARLPTGVENIRAVYRTGIGKPGNVDADQISTLQTKPLGVKAVINPLRASGGADREGRDQARSSVPLAVMALDRLVSVRDYQDFARNFAGIGKAQALALSDGRRQLVLVTIAGADDIPIDETSDLFQNLSSALLINGAPGLPVRLAVRELLLLVISARVRLRVDYVWEVVVENLRASLLQAFSFQRSELGRDVYLSQVIAVIQAVPGVDYVDVDTFGGIAEKVAENFSGEGEPVRRLLTPDEITATVQTLIAESDASGRPQQVVKVNLAALEQGILRPAQLAFLNGETPETLILNQIE